MKKGFTLVEVLAVITIMGILLFVVTPTVTNVLKKNKEKLYAIEEKKIIENAKAYTAKNSGDLKWVNNQTTVYFNELVAEGLTNKQYKNHLTGKVMGAEGEGIVITKDVNGNYSYEIKPYETTPESCFSFDVPTKTIFNYSDTCPKDVVIPSTIGGVTVESIGTIHPMDCWTVSAVKTLESKTFINTGQYRYCEINYDLVDWNKIGFDEKELTSVYIPEGVKYLGYDSFRRNFLKKVIIPSTVEIIDSTVFQSNLLEKVAFMGPTKAVRFAAFENNKIKSLMLPEGLINIGPFGFRKNKLERMAIPDSVEAIEDAAFHINHIASISLPENINYFSEDIFNCNRFPDANAFVYKRNLDGSDNTTHLIGYRGAKLSNIVIPSNVITIGSGSFYGCEITSINIPNTVTTIEATSFSYNNLSSVAIPNSVTTIGYNAFGWNYIPQGSATIDRAAGSVTIHSTAFECAGRPLGAVGCRYPLDHITPVYLR